MKRMTHGTWLNGHYTFVVGRVKSDICRPIGPIFDCRFSRSSVQNSGLLFLCNTKSVSGVSTEAARNVILAARDSPRRPATARPLDARRRPVHSSTLSATSPAAHVARLPPTRLHWVSRGTARGRPPESVRVMVHLHRRSAGAKA